MPLMAWKEKYSMGLRTMDDQHAELLAILNDLHAAMLKGQAQSVAAAVFEKLVRHVQDHFSAEEALLADVGFPGLAEHRAQHQELNGKLEEYIDRFERGDDTMYPELLRFVRESLVLHMQEEDTKYNLWMKERGAD